MRPQPTALGRGGTRVARYIATVVVTRTQVIDGRLFVDCVDPMTGQQFPQVALLRGGGGPGAYRTEPVAAPAPSDAPVAANPDRSSGAQVVIAFRDSKCRSGYIVGTVDHVAARLATVPVSDLEDMADHPGTVSAADFGWQNAGVRVLLDGAGRVVIDGRQSSSRPVRVQLREDGFLRVSRRGQATETVLLGQATRTWLAGFVAKHNSLVATVNALHSTVQQLAAHISAAPGEVYGSVIPYTGSAVTSQASPPTSLEAACVRISSDPEEE